MTSPVTAPALVVPPPNFTPTGQGLLSVVQPRYEETTPHWRNGVTWQAQCGGGDSTYNRCVAITSNGRPPAPSPKGPTSQLVVRGATPFTVYAEIDCNPVGFWEEAAARADDALARTERWQVEHAFWTGLADGQPVVYPHLAADAPLVDAKGRQLQTPATVIGTGTLDLAEGLGLLEAALADCYGGAGVIHVPAGLLPALHGQLIREPGAGRLRTWNGNLVAVGDGYPGTGPDGSPPPPNAMWMYATGAVFAYRSEATVFTPRESFDRGGNTVRMLAERTYLLGWDCCHLAVLVRNIGCEGGGGMQPNEIHADPPLAWDVGSQTMSLQPGTNGQVMMTEDGTPQWESPGQPGGLPGPLDGSGKLPTSQLPPAELHSTFDAASEAEMLAEPAQAPSICIRTDFDPPHLFFLHDDPASDINNWKDLGPGISTGDDPTAQVGTAPINGSAATYMRSDGAPAINQGMSPTWTGHHTFSGQVTIPGGTAGQVATSDAGGNLTWQTPSPAPVQSVNGKTGVVVLAKGDIGLANVDNTSDMAKPVSTAQQAALGLKVDKAGDTMTGDLHMSEQRVVNIADGTDARDAVNRQQLDTKANAADLTAHEAQQGVAGVHLPTGGSTGQVAIRGTGSTVAWADPPSAPVQSVNGDTGAVVLAASDVGAIPTSELGQANGVATLDGSGKVPAGQLNVSGGFSYLGSWDASTNTPTLSDATGNNGDMYKVATAGSQDLGSGTVAFDVGDHVVYVAGTANQWQKFTTSEAVSSVAGKTGVVTLVKGDVGLDQVDNTSDAAKPISTATQTALDTKLTTPTPLTTKVVLGTSLAQNTIGLVGYDQDVLGDTLAMRQFGGQVSTAEPTDDAHAATKAYVDNHAANGAAAWGGITGTLANQSDLMQALNGRVLLTSKATQTDATTGTDNDKWMTPLGTAQAIAAHQQTMPDIYSAFRTSNAGSSDPTNFTDLLIGPTPGTDESWQIDWVLYVSSPGGRIECALATQTGLNVLTGGFGNLIGADEGVVNSPDTTSIIFKTDAPIRLLRLTSYISTATTGTFLPVRLQFRSPDSVAVTAHAGSHAVATKLLTAI